MQLQEQSRFQLIAALIGLIFFIKFAAYAWYVTPLWDIPDESGHYAYAEDVSQLEWPVLGKARIDEDVMHSWKGAVGEKGGNWIAQHPPFFYTLDAPVIAAARHAGADLEQRVRLARLPSALFGALTIVGLLLFLTQGTGSQTLGLTGAILFAATPMFTHLSTGVTHDTLVACTAAWGAYWCTRWLESNRDRHLLYAGLLVALCILTKITALAMAVPLFFALAWRLWKVAPSGTRAGYWLARTAALWLVMFTPIVLWMARNMIIFGQPLPDASILSNDPKVEIGFFDLMRKHPFWKHTILNFISLIGWNGSNNGQLAWIQANGRMARFFLVVFFGMGLTVLLMPAVKQLTELPRRLALGAGLVLVVLAFSTLSLEHLPGWTCLVLFLAMTVTLVGHARDLASGKQAGWLLAAAAACVLFFAFVYYHHLWSAYTGSMRATHGRYFYPVVPFILLVLVWPFRGTTAAGAVLYSSVLAMIVSETFFLHQVFPMYGQI